MSKIVVGLFESRDHAEIAARQIKERGLRTEDISIIARQGDDSSADTNASMVNEDKQINDNISGGVMTGGVLGGVAGALIGAGSLMIPGLGIIAAAGPITGLLSGTVTGGIVGGLVDLGIPENKSKQHEEDIRQGKVLFSMRTDEDKINRVTSILRNSGASNVEVHE